MGKKIDFCPGKPAGGIRGERPGKSRVVREEMLFYVRQKVQDLLTQLAVNIQGYLALDMVRKNNLELIKGWTGRRRRPSQPCALPSSSPRRSLTRSWSWIKSLH